MCQLRNINVSAFLILALNDILHRDAGSVAFLIGRLRSSTFRLFYLHGMGVTCGHMLLYGIGT